MKKNGLFFVVSMLLAVFTFAQPNTILVNGVRNPPNLCSWNGGFGSTLNIQLSNPTIGYRLYYKPIGNGGCPYLTGSIGAYNIGIGYFYAFSTVSGNVITQCGAAGGGTGCSTYWGNIIIAAVSTQGNILDQLTITIHPPGSALTGPSSFRGSVQLSTPAAVPNWQLSDNFNYNFSSFGTNTATLSANTYTPLNSPVQVTATSFCLNNILTTNRDPLIYVSASNYPYCEMKVDVADHPNANYPNAPSWAGLKHFTYNWLYNGSSMGTGQTFFYSAMASGSTLQCEVKQYQWNGTTWVLETQELSNTKYFTGGASCSGGIGLKLQKDLLSAVSVSPSPFRDEFTLKMNLLNSGTYSFELYDLRGKVVKEGFKNKKLDSGNHVEVVNASSLAPGIYIYKIRANDQVYTGKIVKE